ncbi:MAG: recombinase family protein [Anaeroplasma sp.]|nr:recombinase family protein [Anaeroplasma sp.]
MNIKVVAYARYSTHHQLESTIETQYDAIEKYSAENGFKIVRKFADRGISGTEVESRDGFMAMMDYITNNKIYAVIVYTRDRFSRSIKDFVHYLNMLESLDCQLLCVNGGNSQTASGRLSEWVNISIADYYVKNLSREVIRGMRYNAENALVNGKPALGYDKGPDGRYVINEMEAKAVKKIFELTYEGKSRRYVSKYLHDNDYRNKNGELIQGPFKRILINRRYIGEYSYHITANGLDENIVIPNAIPRIIDDEVFEAVQKIVEEQATHLDNMPKTLLYGKVIDGYCGYKFKANTTGYDSDGERKDFLYRPDTDRIGVKRAKDISGNVLESFTICLVEETLLSLNSLKIINELVNKSFSRQKKKLEQLMINKIASKDDVLVRYNNCLKELLIATSEENKRLLNEINDLSLQIKKIDEELNDLSSKISESPNLKYTIVFGKVRNMSAVMTKGNPAGRKQIIRRIIKRIILYDDFVRFEIDLNAYIGRYDVKQTDSNVAWFDILRRDIIQFVNQTVPYTISINELNLALKEE